MKFNNKQNKEYKVGDITIWDSRSVAVCTVVLLNMKEEVYVLICKRGNNTEDCPNMWNLPSGFLDKNESGTEAAIREVWEETNLNLFKKHIVLNNLLEPWKVKSEPDENRQNVTLRYGCIINENVFPELSNENAEEDEVSFLRWIKIDDVEKYDFAFNHDKVIKDYISYTSILNKIKIISLF